MSTSRYPRGGAITTGAFIAVLAAGAFAASPAIPVQHGRAAARAAAARATAGPATAGPATARHAADMSATVLRAAAHPGVITVQPGGPLAVPRTGPTAAPAFPAGTTAVTSRNWGGYIAGRGGVRFRYIRATFFVPYLDCASSPLSFSGHWVGLDGAGSPTVEQDGILAACQGATPEYSAWYEMFPLPPVYSKMTVRPGNSIVASVFYNGHSGKFTLSVTDTTTGARFTRTQNCPTGVRCQRLSAEAISEAPSSGSSILPLTNFRAESYNNIAVTSQGGRHGGLRAPWWDTLAVTTEGNGGNVIDQPTSIFHGRSFDCYWMATS